MKKGSNLPMKKGRLRIELLSDLLPGSGEGHDASIDSDVCFDAQGLPLIPGKRIKGLLREAMEELDAWGQHGLTENLPGDSENKGCLGSSRLSVAKIFGEKKYSEAGLIVVDNAKLDEHDKIAATLLLAPKQEGAKEELKTALHPQMVLSNFTSIRSQTAVEAASGTAKRGFLRSLRVLDKALTFFCPISYPCQAQKQIEEACLNLRSMGSNRSRGLGRVRVLLETLEAENCDTDIECPEVKTLTSSAASGLNVQRAEPEPFDTTCLNYFLTLKSPCILQSPEGGENGTQSYIEGVRMLGLVAAQARRKGEMKAFSDLLQDENLIFSHAYLSDGRVRFEPLMSSVLKEKDGSSDKAFNALLGLPDIRTAVYSTSYFSGSYDRVESQSNDPHSETKGSGTLLQAETSVNYHHAWGEDRSIGSSKEHAFYQLTSLDAGQCFAGTIRGKSVSLQKIKTWLEQGDLRLGYAKSAEYGAVELRFAEGPGQNSKRICKGESGEAEFAQKVVLHLLSPLIMFNEQAMPTTDINSVKAYFFKATGIWIKKILYENSLGDGNEAEANGVMVSASVIGGFNTTWQLPKPRIQCLAAGSVMCVELDEEISLNHFAHFYLGERVREGYGEVRLHDFERLAKQLNLSEATSVVHPLVGLAADWYEMPVMKQLFKNYIRYRLQSDIWSDTLADIAETKVKESSLGHILLIYQRNESHSKYKACVRAIDEKNKNKFDSRLYELDVARKWANEVYSKLLAATEQSDISSEDILSDDELYRLWFGQMIQFHKIKQRQDKMKQTKNKQDATENLAEQGGVKS